MKWVWLGLIAVLGFLLLSPVQRAFLSAAVTLNLLVPMGEWRPLELATEEPIMYDVLENIDGRDIVVRVWKPTTGEAAVLGLVIYTPLIGGGLDDERLTNLGSSWARAGVPVAVPWSESGLAIQVNDKEEVITAARVLESETEVERVGLFGISYGNGPVFAAAVDDRLREKVELIVSLNGMYDLAEVVEFIDSGASHVYGREVVAATRAAGVSLAQVRDELSPAEVVEKLSVPVYIVHSTSDVYIPYSQSVKLHEALQMAGKETQLVLTDVIEHGAYRRLTPVNVFQHYLPAGFGFGKIIYEVLDPGKRS